MARALSFRDESGCLLIEPKPYLPLRLAAKRKRTGDQAQGWRGVPGEIVKETKAFKAGFGGK